MDDLAAALKDIPQGWTVAIGWHHDDWPCVEVKLSRDFGRDTRIGHGNSDNITAAILAAVQDAVAQIKH